MDFTIGYKRQIVGYRIEVEVKADGAETIVAVETSYDNFQLAYDYLSPPQVGYKRIFSQVGGYTPGVERTVTVTATNNAGIQKVSSTTWQD